MLEFNYLARLYICTYMILTFELRGCSSVQPVFLLLKARDFQMTLNFFADSYSHCLAYKTIMFHSIMVFIRFCFYFISRIMCLLTIVSGLQKMSS